MIPTLPNHQLNVIDQGAWMSKGIRSAQEDAYILYEIHDTHDQSYVLAGIFDGHLGNAASSFVRDELPTIFHIEILDYYQNNMKEKDMDATNTIPLFQIIENSWDKVCTLYRDSCSIEGMKECVAEYDPIEGILMANTGSQDAVAGTTASMFVVNQETGQVVSLNCGDSRSIVITKDGKVHYQTIDHTPKYDYERFVQGKNIGYDYSLPQCAFNTWRVAVGDYDYAVSRSLEGNFATSKGIVSTPDINLIPIIISDEESTGGMIIFIASDGFWEVIDSEEAAKLITQYRTRDKMNANEVSKQLCALAIQKGSSDNVSAVVLFLK